MGWEPSKQRVDPLSSIPKDMTPINVDVIYCQAWGGYSEASQAERSIKTVFPNAQVNKTSPGVTRNLEIKYNGEIVYDKNGGDGRLTKNSAIAMINRLKHQTGSGWGGVKEYGDCRNEGCLGNLKPGYLKMMVLCSVFCHVLDIQIWLDWVSSWRCLRKKRRVFQDLLLIKSCQHIFLR